MSGVRIENLFNRNRFPHDWRLIPLILYAPIGCTLAIVRSFIAIHALLLAYLLPSSSIIRQCVLRTMCVVLGIIVQEENVELKRRQIKILICNHVTVLDHVVVNIVLPSVFPAYYDLPAALNNALNFKDLSRNKSRETFVQKLRNYCNDAELPVLCFPERETTNGRSGILQFETWPFSLEQAILPIVIKVQSCPIPTVFVSPLDSRWYSDVFWMFFQPATLFTIKYLPAAQIQPEENEENFSERVGKTMARSLGITYTLLTAHDKREYSKRMRLQTLQNYQNAGARTAVSFSRVAEVKVMANQVREVLPYVPYDAICKDILKTHNVDATISNILDGRVAYTPEPIKASSSDSFTRVGESARLSQSATTTNQNSKTTRKDALNASGTAPVSSQSAGSPIGLKDNFSKLSSQRMLSLEDRKRLMIDAARAKYLETHPELQRSQ